MKLERLLELAGTQLNELDGIEVTHNKDNIQSLKAKLKKANVDVSNMTDDMVLKFANKMDEITIEGLKSKGMLKEQTED